MESQAKQKIIKPHQTATRLFEFTAGPEAGGDIDASLREAHLVADGMLVLKTLKLPLTPGSGPTRLGFSNFLEGSLSVQVV